MSEESPVQGREEELPEAVVQSRRGISMVWIFPIVAALIAGGLAWRTLSQRGPTIAITFPTASGLQAGKTTLRYKAVEIGTVQTIHVAPDRSHVVVTVDVVKPAEGIAVEGSRFWVVRAHIGTAGVSGLGTLVSGVYIAVDPGPLGAARAHSFEGLPDAPLDVGEEAGLRLVLESDTLGGLGEGAAVVHRGVRVGTIGKHRFTKDGEDLEIDVLIDPAYTSRVNENSVFWNASGVDLSVSAWRGVEIDVESLRSILAGGVAFDTPGPPGKPLKSGARFKVFAKRDRAMRHYADRRGLRVAVETPTLGALNPGDPVYYRKEKVGDVIDHELHADGRSVGILLHIDAPYHNLVRTNTVFWNASGFSADLGLTGLHIHTESLASLLAGGVSFATPDKPGAPVASGSVFELHTKGKEEWLSWSPRIWIGKGKDPSGGDKSAPAQERRLVHHKPEAQKDPESHHWFHGLFHRGKGD